MIVIFFGGFDIIFMVVMIVMAAAIVVVVIEAAFGIGESLEAMTVGIFERRKRRIVRGRVVIST